VRLEYEKDYGWMRWTVDTAEDLELIRQVAARLRGHSDFSWLDVVAIFQREPELAKINASVQHRTMFDVDERFKR
jgi:spore coat polysaccharide biosynthesis protein SpsF (cytidylyltransferase family)